MSSFIICDDNYRTHDARRALLVDGAPYEAPGYPMGGIPNSELTVEPTTAIYDASTDAGGASKATSEEFPDIPEIPLSSTVKLKKNPFTGDHFIYEYPDATKTVFTQEQGSPIVLFASRSPGSTFTQIYKRWLHTAPETDDPDIQNTTTHEIYQSYTHNGLTVYYVPVGLYQTGYTVECNGIVDLTSVPFEEAAWVMIYGDIEETQAGSHQTINVSWPRPGDGQVLETTFEILVGPSPSGDDDN